jgi:hypothetical protein
MVPEVGIMNGQSHPLPSLLRRGDPVTVVIDGELFQGVTLFVDHEEVQIHARPRPGWTWVGRVRLSDEGTAWCRGSHGAALHALRAALALA